MNKTDVFVQDLRRLMSDTSFVTTIFAVVAAAAVMAFGFGAPPDIIALMLILGAISAFAEDKLRKKN